MKVNIVLSVIVLIISISCSDMIEYSPYDANIESRDLNKFYSENLGSTQTNRDSLSFAVFSDNHFYYDELNAAVNSINNKPNLSFVVACGDITDSGLAKEYQLFWRQVKKLKHPLITIIGNHDHLSNGAISYKRMFGDPNFSFSCGSYKFIGFNSTVWENNNKSPDFEWLKDEVNKSDQKCVILTHIPPWGDQFTPENEDKYYEIAANPQVLLNIHGHIHKFCDTLIHNKRYITPDEVYIRRYLVIHLYGNNIEFENVQF
jgi:Icc-related predicted phosphoesterase